MGIQPVVVAASSVSKNLKRLAWVTGGATFGYASNDQGTHHDFENITKDLPNLNWEKANKIRAALAEKAPIYVDRQLIKNLKIKDHAGAPLAYAYKDQAIILTENTGPDSKNGWSDFMYLRELSKLHKGEIQQRQQMGNIYYGIMDGGAVYYFLKKPSIKRGLAAYSLCFVGTVGLIVADQSLRYHSELVADQFAIKALEADNDLPGLERGYQDLVAKRAKTIKFDELKKDASVLNNVFSKPENVKAGYLINWVTQGIVITDACHEKRLANIKTAIDDLKKYPKIEFVSDSLQ